MVQCKQQKGEWECGYLVIRHMFEFLRFYVDQIPIRMWKNTSYATDKDMDLMLKTLMPTFFSELVIRILSVRMCMGRG
ncbi:hypothetical protein M8C21_008144 [Ambrosia artemisiifolia]|uniref:Uncharacterized protein n=1 Tax=Ambrosia artemisiifolia TaxID=4212 RepID=A0AAD5CSM5_AMBAR|nr:hypothetical protein M8C21_008144 [Ambrosia artemisiifolia]